MASMARTATKTRRKRINLHEDIVRGMEPLAQGRSRVDREKKIIYGVKILGKDSVNDREYTLDARRLAVKQGLYEGRAVYTNHPAEPNDPRLIREKFGRLVNVRLYQDEPYGDLEYLENNPDTELILEVAERMPEQFGLSHNAKGEGREKDGVFLVEEIVEVRSVDVVCEPATTNGFFEHRTMKITIKQLFENSWKKYSRKCTKRPRLSAVMKRLVEDDAYDVMDEEPEGTEQVPADHEEALRDGFEASVSAIVRDCLDGEEDPKESIKKIKELLDAHAKLSQGDDAEEDDMEEEKPKDDKDDKDDKKETEEQRRLKQLERKDKARDLCEEMGIACDKVLLEALMHLPDDKGMKKLLEREKGKGSSKPSGNAPRSGASGGGKGDTQTTLEGVDTPEGVLATLLG